MSQIPHGSIHIAPGYRLTWDEAQQGHLLLHPQGRVPLTAEQAKILEHCNGSHSADELVAELQGQLPEDEIREFLAVAHTNNWIHGQ